jgi:hypothetical protein
MKQAANRAYAVSAGFLLGFFLNHENEDDIFFRHVRLSELYGVTAQKAVLFSKVVLVLSY